MSKKIVTGMFVWYRTTRNVFAKSSGSWKGPSEYARPCVISKIVDGRAFLKPVTGAKPNSSGILGPPTNMNTNWWAAVKFSNSLIATPPDTVKINTTPRLPILVTIPSDLTGIVGKYKPCYMWDGDDGESLTLEELAELTLLDKNQWFCDEAELAKLDDFATFWKQHDPPEE